MDSIPNPVRVAAFDLDDTLIRRPVRRGPDIKWSLLDKRLPSLITNNVNDGYIVVIFSNQSGMQSNANFDKHNWRQQVDITLKKLFANVKHYYCAVYVSKKYDLFRKPNIGLWNLMLSNLRDNFPGTKISKMSFFCGDAAGRIKPSNLTGGKRGDHSDTDRKFAINIGIKFVTPEEYILNVTDDMPYMLSGLDPTFFLSNLNIVPYTFVPRKKELIVMIGSPGSGKTSFVEKYILPHKYVLISNDIYRYKQKCFSLVADAVSKNKSIVIDNTSYTVMQRMDYTLIAKKGGYTRIRAIHMNTEISLAKHLNNVRHIYSRGKTNKVNNIVYSTFLKNFAIPVMEEGYDLIEEVDFIFDNDMLTNRRWLKSFNMLSEY
jgi:bifunctional polynucleotide phosphatase/kinase